MNGGERYRRLPGRRRGLIIGNALWLGSDHLLWVRNMRIREDYKRFHFRDVQAIAVASAPRFHISTRALLLGAVWLAAYLVTRAALPQYTWIPWSLGAALVLAWIVISARWSCRCRLYTAVSREELPSIYRTWTARKFLREVTPRIAEVQGNVAANWAEAAEEIVPGPAAQPAMPAEGSAAALRAHAPVHTLAADLFIATLWASALADMLLLHANSRAATWSQVVFPLTLLGESVILFVQHYRGLLQSAMRNLAIANLAAMGTMYYVRQMVASFNSARQPSVEMKIPLFYYGGAWTRGIDAGICIILGLVGLGIIFLHRAPRDGTGMNL